MADGQSYVAKQVEEPFAKRQIFTLAQIESICRRQNICNLKI